MQRAYAGAIHCVFDQIPNLQNCFTTPNKTQEGMGPQTLPPSPFTGQFLRKADIQGLVSLWIFGPCFYGPMAQYVQWCTSTELQNFPEGFTVFSKYTSILF